MDKTYIDDTLDELYSKLGIYKVLSTAEFYRRASHSIEEANKVITAHLRIKNPVLIRFVSPESPRMPDFVAGPVGTAMHDQSVSHYTPGRIIFPSTPFIYGISQTPITIEVDERHKDDIYIIGSILSHENTHLLLKLLFCEGSEVYTDLAAIVLGLSKLMARGRHSFTTNGYLNTISTIGYLEDESFNYAYKKTTRISRDCEKQRVAIRTMAQQNNKLLELVEAKYQLIASNILWINKEATSLNIKPSEGKQFVEMNNYVFQNELPGILSVENNALEKTSEQLKDYGGFIISQRGQFDHIQTQLVRQAILLRSILNMLQKWLELQNKYMRPKWWRFWK